MDSLLSQGFAVLAVLRPFLPTALLLLLIVYFGLNAFTGDRGLLSSNQRDAALVVLIAPAVIADRPHVHETDFERIGGGSTHCHQQADADHP